jgi:hypothetical protein
VPPVPLPVAAVPLILADFSSEPYSLPMLRSVAAALAPSCDAVLVGEHQNWPDFPPALHASLLLEAGMRPWMTLACRDRNRIVLEQELQELSTLLHAADLEVGQEADPGAMPPPAPDWQDRVAAVERELQRRFGSTPRLAAATEQSDRIAAMLGAGQLTSQVLTLRRSG